MTLAEKIDALARADFLPSHDHEFVRRMKAVKDLDVALTPAQIAEIGRLHAKWLGSS